MGVFLTKEMSEGPVLSSYRSCCLEDVISAGVSSHTVLTKSPLRDRLPFISTWGGIKALLGKNLVNNKKIRAHFHTKNRISKQFI